MSDSVRMVVQEILCRAVGEAQADGLLAQVPLQIPQKVHGDRILPQQRQRVGDWHATRDWRKAAACLAWTAAIRQVLEVALSLLGVSAPQEMKRADAAEDRAALDEP